jgi:hypothetical protein
MPKRVETSARWPLAALNLDVTQRAKSIPTAARVVQGKTAIIERSSYVRLDVLLPTSEFKYRSRGFRVGQSAFVDDLGGGRWRICEVLGDLYRSVLNVVV